MTPAAQRAVAVAAEPSARGSVRVFERYGARLATDFPNHPMASLFSSPSWIEALAATYGFDIKASTLVEGGDVTAAILFAEIEDIRGRRVVSLPFCDYLDPLVEDEATWFRLMAPILELGAPVRLRSLRSRLPSADRRFVAGVGALWHGADLDRSEADLWSALSDSAPRNIRKAERHGVVIREGRSLDDLRIFYEMHCAVRKTKYRMLAQPFALFENLHAAFAPDDRLVVLLAEIDGEAIGGIVFLIDGDTLYYKFNASRDTALRPNDLLVWTGMLLGRRRGLAQLDFGISDRDQPGLIRFKRKFASEERAMHELRWSPQGYADRRAAETGEVLHRFTQLMTLPEVPSGVTRAAGDALYRFFC